MANNRNRDSNSGNTPTTSGDNAVFVDTSLDTHLAVIVSDSDTVSDLKKKIVSEHSLCFPNFGDIKINALKVKRRRCLYHLSDSMLVRSAFEGAKKCWFISVGTIIHIQEHSKKELNLKSNHSEELKRVQLQAENEFRERTTLLQNEHEAQLRALKCQQEDECRKLQEELDIQKSKCLCCECAKELRLQSNKCPICRQPIQELMEIKITEGQSRP